MLFECRQIFDSDTGKRHPAIIAVNKLDDVQLDSELIKLPRLKGYLKTRGY